MKFLRVLLCFSMFSSFLCVRISPTLHLLQNILQVFSKFSPSFLQNFFTSRGPWHTMTPRYFHEIELWCRSRQQRQQALWVPKAQGSQEAKVVWNQILPKLSSYQLPVKLFTKMTKMFISVLDDLSPQQILTKTWVLWVLCPWLISQQARCFRSIYLGNFPCLWHPAEDEQLGFRDFEWLRNFSQWFRFWTQQISTNLSKFIEIPSVHWSFMKLSSSAWIWFRYVHIVDVLI